MEAVEKRETEVPSVIRAPVGAGVPEHGATGWETNADQTEKAANAIVALPLGARVKVEPWDDRLVMLKAQPEDAVTVDEKMPFEGSPFLVYLTRQNGTAVANDVGAGAIKTEKNLEPPIGKP